MRTFTCSCCSWRVYTYRRCIQNTKKGIICKWIKCNKSYTKLSNLDAGRKGGSCGIFGVTCATCGVVPGRQADCFLEEAELGMVKPESLVDNVRRWLHVHLADGHRLAVFCFERNLMREGEMSAVSAACSVPVMKQHLHHHRGGKLLKPK